MWDSLVVILSIVTMDIVFSSVTMPQNINHANYRKVFSIMDMDSRNKW